MGELFVHISTESRKRLEKLDPDILRDIDAINSETQDKINDEWNNNQGPKRPGEAK